uniref:DmX-like protein 1 (inferred by orthology to a human protein) n=1 Tax=Strongyloides venezuelensis TaxID=75913 RepID=A0A0K0F1L8_STRVS
MEICDIYHGAIRNSTKCCGIGCVNNLWFITCCLNGDVVIFDRNINKIQNIIFSLNYKYEEISNIVCCEETGKIFISANNIFEIFAPIYNLHDNEIKYYKWEKLDEIALDVEVNTGAWYHNGTKLIVSAGNLLNIYEINLYNNNLNNENIQELVINKIWEYSVSSPITIISASNDSMFFATSGNNDTKVVIWYQMVSYSSQTMDKKLTLDFTILNHPTSVVGFEWRKIPKEIFRYEIENCIITFCKDGVARVWKENVLNEELYVDHDLEHISDILYGSTRTEEKQQKRQNYFKKMKEKILVKKHYHINNNNNNTKKIEKLKAPDKRNLNIGVFDLPVKMKTVFFYIVSSIVQENISGYIENFGNNTEVFTPRWLNNKSLAFMKNIKKTMSTLNFNEVEEEEEEEIDNKSECESIITIDLEKLYNDWKETSDGLFYINENNGTLTIWNLFNLDSSFKSCDTKLISSTQNVIASCRLPSKISYAVFIPYDKFTSPSPETADTNDKNTEKNTCDMEDVNSTLIIIYKDGRIDASKANIHCQSNLTFLESINYDTFLDGAKYNIESITSYLDFCLTIGSKESTNKGHYHLEIILWKIINFNEIGKKCKLEDLKKFYLNVNEYYNKITWLHSGNDSHSSFPLTFSMCYDKKLHIYQIYENNTHANKGEFLTSNITIKSAFSVDIIKYTINNIYCLYFTTPSEVFQKDHSELNYLFIIGNCESLKIPKIILWEYDEKNLNVNLVSVEYFNEKGTLNAFIIPRDKSIKGMMYEYIAYPKICLQTTDNSFNFYNITKECNISKNNGMTFNGPHYQTTPAIYDGKMALLIKYNNELVLNIYECQNLDATVWNKESSHVIQVTNNINTKDIFISWLQGTEKVYYLCIQICQEVQIFSLSLHNKLFLVCRFFLDDKSGNLLLMEWIENNKFLLGNGNTLKLYSLDEETINILKNKNIQYHPNYLIYLIETNNYDIVNSILKNIFNQVKRYNKYSKNINNTKSVYIEPIPESEIKKVIALRSEQITLDEYIERKNMEEMDNNKNKIVDNSSNLFNDDSSNLFDRRLSFDDKMSIGSEDFNIDTDSDDEIDGDEMVEKDDIGNSIDTYTSGDGELSEDDCKILTDILKKIELTGLNKDEMYQLISVIEGVTKYYQIKHNIAYDNCSKKYYTFFQIFTSLKKMNNSKIYPFPSSTIIWAFHSTSENELFENVLIEVNDNVCWKNLVNYGIGWWLKHPDNLKTCFEKLAQHAFLKKNNPMDAAVYYMVLRKRNIIATLFRKQHDVARSNFFLQSYENEKDRIFAMRNAFNCISKGEYLYAVAIFLCCNDIENALKVVMERLSDIQLGIMIVKTHVSNVFEQDKHIESIILKYVLNLTRQKIEKWKDDVGEGLIDIDDGSIAFVEGAHDDPFIRSMAFYMIKEYYLSSITLLNHEKYTKENSKTDANCSPSQLPTLFILYKYLKSNPYVLRQKKILNKNTLS